MCLELSALSNMFQVLGFGLAFKAMQKFSLTFQSLKRTPEILSNIYAFKKVIVNLFVVYVV